MNQHDAAGDVLQVVGKHVEYDVEKPGVSFSAQRRYPPMKLVSRCAHQVRRFLLLFIILTACAKQAEPPPTPSGTSTAPAEPRSQTVDNHALSGNGAGLDASPGRQQRLVSRRAELTLVSDQVSELADKAALITLNFGGYLADQRQTYRGAQLLEATLVLKVPAKSFEAALGQLKAAAKIAEESISTQDVTDEFTDVQAQLRAQYKLESRLLKLLDDANTVTSILEVERELARVRTGIERLSGREQLLKNQTQFATIQVLIQSPEQPVAGTAQSLLSRFENAISDALSLSVSVMIGAIHLAGALLPFVAVLSLGCYAYKRYQRRKRRGVSA